MSTWEGALLLTNCIYNFLAASNIMVEKLKLKFILCPVREEVGREGERGSLL